MPNQSSGSPSAATFSEMRQRAREIFDHALERCNIATAMQTCIQAQGTQLRIANHAYELKGFSGIKVVSIGKAGHSMAEALSHIIGSGLHGIVSCPSAPAAQVFGFRYFIGGHPMPNAESLRAGEAILKALAGSDPSGLTIFCIS